MEPPQRNGDFHIMDKLGPLHTPLKAMRINQCRLCLRFSCLSDITHTNGKSFLSQALYSDILSHRRSQLTWPRILRPPELFWKTWRTALLRLLSINGKAQTLRDCLGPWTHGRIATEWQFLYDPSSDHLLSHDTEWLGYRQHPPLGRSTLTTRRYGPPSMTFIAPSADAVPVMARTLNPSTYIIGRPSPITPSPVIVPPSTFMEFVALQPPVFRRLLFDLRADEATLLLFSQHLETAQTYIATATDGGVKYQIGAFSWVFDMDSTIRIRCSGPADCTTLESEPKRAELYGILSFLTFICMVVEYYQLMPAATLQIYCDDINTVNDLAVFRDMQRYNSFATTKQCCAHYDLIAEILTCMTNYPRPIHLHHVKGHQDKGTPMEELSSTAQLNCVAHQLCLQQLQRLIAANEPCNNPGHFPNQQCSVLHQQRCISGPLTKRLQTISSTPCIKTYWKRCFDWSPRDLDNLDRCAFAHVHLRLPKPDQRRITQFRCGWLPVNKRCSKWMKTRTDICPCCRIATESVDHLLICWDNTKPTGNLYDLLHASMTKVSYHPSITAAVLDGVIKLLFPDDISGATLTSSTLHPNCHCCSRLCWMGQLSSWLCCSPVA
jgi:hypothetical protein